VVEYQGLYTPETRYCCQWSQCNVKEEGLTLRKLDVCAIFFRDLINHVGCLVLIDPLTFLVYQVSEPHDRLCRLVRRLSSPLLSSPLAFVPAESPYFALLSAAVNLPINIVHAK